MAKTKWIQTLEQHRFRESTLHYKWQRGPGARRGCAASCVRRSLLSFLSLNPMTVFLASLLTWPGLGFSAHTRERMTSLLYFRSPLFEKRSFFDRFYCIFLSKTCKSFGRGIPFGKHTSFGADRDFFIHFCTRLANLGVDFFWYSLGGCEIWSHSSFAGRRRNMKYIRVIFLYRDELHSRRGDLV